MNKTCTILRACGNEVNGGARPLRPSYFSKFKCAASLLKPELGGFKTENSDVMVVWDGPENELLEYIKSFPIDNLCIINEKSNQKSLSYCFDLIWDYTKDYESFFLSEDDHAYLPGAFYIFREALNAFGDNFIALGDHADRYKIGNGDIIGTDGVFLTKNRHWRTADSYVFSFGFSSQLFLEFENDLRHFNDSGVGAVRDRDFFHHVIMKKKRLFTPMPAMSTHLIKTDLSPCINWAKYLEDIKL